MPKIKDIELNQSAYAGSEYVSEWTNVTSAAYTTFTVFCSGACNIEIEFSFDTTSIEDTIIKPVLAGETVNVTKPVATPFQRFKVTGISPPQDLKLQGYFFQDELGITNLENVGTGAEIYDSPNAIRSLVSGDGTLTITQNSDELDLSAAAVGSTITLSSAGGTFSLVNDGTGPALANKGLIAGANITIVDSGTDLEIVGSTPPTVTLGSAGGSFSLVADGVGPALANKGLTAGPGINISNGGTQLTISTDIGEENLAVVDGPININNSIFTSVASLVYRGSSNVLPITSVKSVVATSSPTGVGEIRLYDVTNLNVIATSANFGPTSGTKIIVDLGVVSNIPINEALLEVQVRKVSGGGNITFHNAGIFG